MKSRNRIIAGLIVLLLLIAAGGYFLLAGDEKQVREIIARITPSPSPPDATVEAPVPPAPPAAPETPVPPPEPPPLPPPPAEPEPPPALYPIAPEPGDKPLPELGKSDKPFSSALDKVAGEKGMPLMLSEELIYHIVVTIDNLPRKHLPASIVPLKRAENAFVVEGKNETLAIGARNARRYAAFMATARTIDSAKLVETYRYFYPLFQRAYQEIGYPRANFNDRLVVAIDDLLAAPEPKAPILLTQPRVLFEYADPDLERRSAGQKIMIRIGRDNAAVIKAKLAEIRALVTRR